MRCATQRAPEFKPAEELSVAGDAGTAPMFAVAPNGTEAAAWVSAPNGGTDGRLYISVNRATPVELRETVIAIGLLSLTVAAFGSPLALVNTVIKPIVVILSLPAILFSLGLFMIVINGFMVYLVGWLIDSENR